MFEFWQRKLLNRHEYLFSPQNPQNYRRYGRKPEESKIKVSIKSYEKILGLTETLDA